ncbi:hypothetical protein BGZ92_008758 [Podila epicladia]|nr:hypothetical protein BGZ92_008758 [Podila epicladia]
MSVNPPPQPPQPATAPLSFHHWLSQSPSGYSQPWTANRSSTRLSMSAANGISSAAASPLVRSSLTAPSRSQNIQESRGGATPLCWQLPLVIQGPRQRRTDLGRPSSHANGHAR